MKGTVGHIWLGTTTGVTLFVIVVPVIHSLAALAGLVGVEMGSWDNPVEVFIFLMTASMLGVFPWGLWIVLTDARKAEVFDRDHEVAAYLIAAMAVFLVLMFLVCTHLQSIYERLPWLFTPGLLCCAAALLYRRWRTLWRFPTNVGLRGALAHGLAFEGET